MPNKLPLTPLLVLLCLAAGKKPGVLKDEALKPGAHLVFEMPDQGKNWASHGKDPIRCQLILPDNWDPKVPSPVWVHFGGGEGWRKGEMDFFRPLVHNQNFVFINVDYPANGYSNGPHVVIQAIKRIQAQVPLNLNLMVASGISSGAYSLDMNAAAPELRPFKYRIICCGGGGAHSNMPKAGRLCSSLWVCGANDKEADGLSRIEDARAGFRATKRAGADTAMIEMANTAHAMNDKYKADIRAWLEDRLPPVVSAKALLKRAENLKKPEAIIDTLKSPLAKIQYAHPDVAKARELLAIAEQQVKDAKEKKK